HLCNRKWIDRSTCQSDCGSLSFRQERQRDEPASFLLLLGSSRRYSVLNRIFCHFWHRKLADSCMYLGSDPIIQCVQLFYLSNPASCRRRGSQRNPEAFQDSGLLGFHCPDGLCWSK